jgi:hypothetical protein
VHPLTGLTNLGSKGHFEDAVAGRRVRHGRVLPSPGQVSQTGMPRDCLCRLHLVSRYGGNLGVEPIDITEVDESQRSSSDRIHHDILKSQDGTTDQSQLVRMLPSRRQQFGGHCVHVSIAPGNNRH